MEISSQTPDYESDFETGKGESDKKTKIKISKGIKNYCTIELPEDRRIDGSLKITIEIKGEPEPKYEEGDKNTQKTETVSSPEPPTPKPTKES